MTDTEKTYGTRHPRLRRGFVVASGLVAALLMLGASVAAEPAPLDARVVWARGPYAYVASGDSLALTPFSRLTFTRKSEIVATAEVERVVDGGMAVARITSGSLAGLKDLRRLRVLAEPPLGPRLLRVGGPSAKRTHLLVACDSTAIATAIVPAVYGLDQVSPSYRLVRNAGDAAHARWPDTLVVQPFDDPADQEIALERGELDVALFWPGELSAHMRQRWKDLLAWPLDRGLIGTAPESGSPESRCSAAIYTAAAFRALGAGLLRGDLDVSGPCGDSMLSDFMVLRYEVDSSCPGRVALERFLNRGVVPIPGVSKVTAVRVSCVDPRTFSSDDVVRATARCQIACAPRVLPCLREIGPAMIAALFECVPPERRP